MSYLLGITGNIACGKTTIGTMLLKLGASDYIDADAIVHSLYEAGTPVTMAIRNLFGNAVIAADGSVDRKILGSLVFGNPSALKQLEAISHPAVHEAITQRLTAYSANAIVVIDAVKLLEGGMSRWCKAVWLIHCDPAEELRRLVEDRRMSLAEAHARMAAQPDEAQRIPLVHIVIDNSGLYEATQKQVETAWQYFLDQLASA